MKVNKRYIRDMVAQGKHLRGFSFFDLTPKQVVFMIDAVVNKIKLQMKTKNIPYFEEGWAKDLKRNNRKIGVLEEVVIHIEDKLSQERYFTIKHNVRGGPVYYPFFKRIVMPKLCQFYDSKIYYKTLLHEYCHAICDLSCVKLGDIAPHREEVLVELCALIICYSCGVDVWLDSLSYISDYYENKNRSFDSYWNDICRYAYSVLSWINDY